MIGLSGLAEKRVGIGEGTGAGKTKEGGVSTASRRVSAGGGRERLISRGEGGELGIVCGGVEAVRGGCGVAVGNARGRGLWSRQRSRLDKLLPARHLDGQESDPVLMNLEGEEGIL